MKKFILISFLATFAACSSLHKSALNGNLSEVKNYIEKEKVDVNALNKKGLTALMNASMKNHLPVVKYLVEKGADVNITSRRLGFTALFKASEAGYYEIVKFLLANKADPNIPVKAVAGHKSYDCSYWVSCYKGKKKNRVYIKNCTYIRRTCQSPIYGTFRALDNAKTDEISQLLIKNKAKKSTEEEKYANLNKERNQVIKKTR